MHWLLSSTKKIIQISINQFHCAVTKCLIPIPRIKLILITVIMVGMICYSIAFTQKNRFHQPTTSSDTFLGSIIQNKVEDNPPTEKQFMKLQTIFMMETTGRDYLTPRQACAVESAARANPSMTILLCLTSTNVDRNNSQMAVLLRLHNVQIINLNITTFFYGSPFETWYLRGAWESSRFGHAHVYDALRLLVLWRFGGIYLDLDMIVIKSLENLYNCIGVESEKGLGLGLMAFKHHHRLIKTCISNFVINYYPGKSSMLGSRLMMAILKKKCSPDIFEFKAPEKFCKEVKILPPSAFYPISKSKWSKIFKSAKGSLLNETFSESFAIKTWSELSYKRNVNVGKGQIFEELALNYCPVIYKLSAMSGEF